MYFPDNVEYGIFLRAALKKGIKVKSKYTGVTISYNGKGYYSFSCCVMIDGKIVRGAKHYPLTMEGEKECHQNYLRLASNKTKKRGGRGGGKKKLNLLNSEQVVQECDTTKAK